LRLSNEPRRLEELVDLQKALYSRCCAVSTGSVRYLTRFLVASELNPVKVKAEDQLVLE
jgi:hypothetical protein